MATIAENSVIAADVKIPEDGSIGYGSVLESNVVWSEGVKIGNYSYVEAGVVLPTPCTIWHWVHVRSDAEIGVNTMLGSQAYVGPHVKIGRNTRIGTAAQLHESARIGKNVFIGPNVFIGNDAYPQIGRMYTPQPVMVGDDAVLCANAIIKGGVKIGNGAVVGMGTVVINDIASGAVVVGNPARVVRMRKKHGNGGGEVSWCPDGVVLDCNDCGSEHWEPVDPNAVCQECYWAGRAEVE